MPLANPTALLDTLLATPRETEWLEFKLNWFEPEGVGAYVAGLANAAILHDQDHAYLVFGVDNATRTASGTSLCLGAERVGNEPFDAWLGRLLNPRLTCEFASVNYQGRNIEILIIDPAYVSPVRFKTTAYIRVGSTLKKLHEYPERERALWARTSRLKFENAAAINHLSASQIFEMFDCSTFLARLSSAKNSPDAVVEHLVMQGFLVSDKQGRFDATNLLAILAALDLSDFPLLARKAPRVVRYSDATKLHGQDDVTGRRGYGIAFPQLLRYILNRIPHSEEMHHGVRRMVYSIPELAVRELVANALIHQDLTSEGNGPFIEIFPDRLKISNPGEPLVSPERFIDAPARSRNEKLAGVMRRLGFCEERGSGIDRAVDAIERAALPPPLFQAIEKSTVVTIYGQRKFSAMTREERIRACYQHACLRFESGSRMNNASLRGRFGLSDKQYSQASTVIRDAIDAGVIRPLDEDQGNRNARYVPFWA